MQETGTGGDEVYAFSSSSLADVLNEFSSMNHALVNIGFVLMVSIMPRDIGKIYN